MTIEHDAVAFWEARLEECLRGANVARQALANLGIIYPVHLVEPEVDNVHQLRVVEPETDDAA